MNAYFACSVTGGRDFEAVYQTLVRVLIEDGHLVPTAHLAEVGVAAVEATITARKYMRGMLAGFENAMSWLQKLVFLPMVWVMRLVLC